MVTYLQYLFASDCLHVWRFSRGIIPLMVKQKHRKKVITSEFTEHFVSELLCHLGIANIQFLVKGYSHHITTIILD